MIPRWRLIGRQTPRLCPRRTVFSRCLMNLSHHSRKREKRRQRTRMQIRLFKPCVGEEELANIRSVFERGWLGLGPLVTEFEREWSEYVGVPTSVGVNSGTAALHLALTAF